MNNQNDNSNITNNTPVQPPNFWGEDLMESTYDSKSMEAQATETVITSTEQKQAAPVVEEIPNNIAGQQPLTIMAQQTEPVVEEPQIVQQNSRFFQQVTVEDNKIKAADLPQVPTAPPVVDPLEASRGIQTNDLVKHFVGPKYQDFTMSSFSLGAAFFGPLYYYYRKMYSYGILLAIINTASLLLLFINIWVYLVASVIIFALVGLYTPTIYMKFCNKKVLKIALDNPNDNIVALQTKCKISGGTSLILAILLNIVINSLCTSVFTIFGGMALITNVLKNLDPTRLEQDTSVKLEEVIDYTLPSTFIVHKEKPEFYAYYETDMVEGTPVERAACIFNVSLVAKYDTSKDLVTHMADVDERYNRVSTYESTLGEVWDMYDYQLSNRQEIYLAKKFDDHIVLISYANMNSSDGDICDQYLLEIIDSVNKK